MMFDAYTIPQDDYFEWDEVIENNICAYPHSIPYLPECQTPTSCYPEVNCLNMGISEKLISSPLDDYHFNWPETSHETANSDKVIPSLPSHQSHGEHLESKSTETTSSPKSKEETLSLHRQVKPFCDDTYLSHLPTRNVDYLAFNWQKCEDDIWATTRYLRSTKAQYDSDDLTYDRLTNACWRALAVGRLNLKKVNPRDFNWLKDQDTTWLHGPFVSHSSTPQPSHVPIESDELPIKSILKKPNLASLLCRGSAPNYSHSVILFTSYPEDLGRRKSSNVRFSTESETSVAIEEIIDRPSSTLRINTDIIIPLGPVKSLENIDTSFKEESFPHLLNLMDASMAQLDYTEEASSICTRDNREVNQDLSVPKMSNSVELLRCDRFSNDMSPSICALRDMMIDTCHRGLGKLQHQSEIYLWPTLIA